MGPCLIPPEPICIYMAKSYWGKFPKCTDLYSSVYHGPACEVVEIFLNKVIKLCDKNQSLVCFVITVKVFVLLYALSCTGDYVSTSSTFIYIHNCYINLKGTF